MKPCPECSTSMPDYYVLCRSCFSNPSIMISHTEAKRRYKLEDDDFDEDIPKQKFSVMGVNCRKYMRLDVHEMARKLVEELDDDDPQRRAYLKQHQIMKRVIDAKKNKMGRVQEIKKQIDTLKEKYVDSEKYEFDDELVKHCAMMINVDTFDTAVFALNKMKEQYYKKLEEQKRVAMIKLWVNNNIQKHHDQMKPYIDKALRWNSSVDKSIQEIDYTYKYICNENERKAKIDEWIKQNVNKHTASIKKRARIYQHSSMSTEKAIEELSNYYKGLIDTAARKYAIEKFVKEEIDTGFHQLVKTNITYRRYIDYGDDFEDIKTRLHTLVRQVKRQERLTAWLRKNRYSQHEVLSWQVSRDYINSQINYTECKKQIRCLGEIYKFIGENVPLEYRNFIYRQLDKLDNDVEVAKEQIVDAIKNVTDDELKKYGVPKSLLDDILINFKNSSDNELVLSGYNGDDRGYIDRRCGQMGINRRFIGTNPNRVIILMK